MAGKKFGIDSKNIYIAGLKIPAAVLALLPIPPGNIDQNRAYNHLMDLRADLQYAAQRAQNLEEFKQMIRDMRLRKEREREFERNQRTAPPPRYRRPGRRRRQRMKLVDTDETVVLVTGSSLTAEERDRPLAYRLKAEIDRRGVGPRLPSRRGGGRSLVPAEPDLPPEPDDRHRRARRERGLAGVLAACCRRSTTGRSRCSCRRISRASRSGRRSGGSIAACTAAAVEVFMTQGFLDDLLGRIWRFRTGVVLS